MIPEILDIQEKIGADPELMEALEAVALTVAQMKRETPVFMMPYRCICSECGKQTNYSNAAEVKAVVCQGCVYAKVAKDIFSRAAMDERKRELARQAESGGARHGS